MAETNEKQDAVAKIRQSDLDRAAQLAERHGSNRKEILSASIEMFGSAPEKRQRDTIARVRERHPMPYPRIGRGNRRVKSAA